MASLLQRLLRSFINTLFYIWTVIQALLSLRSPKLNPFREPATVVPYIVDVDLERCSGRRERATPMPSTPPPSAYPKLPQTAISRTIDADSRWQNNLRSSSVFSPSTPGVADRKNSNAALSASLRYLEGLNRTNINSRSTSSRSTSSPMRDEITEDSVRISDEPFQDPFLDTRLVHPFSFSPGKFELDHFKLPYCTSTPPRTHKRGKGHKRTALATITNIAHLALPVSFSESLPSPIRMEPFVDTPLAQRTRRLSLRRKAGRDDLHSPSAVQSTPTKSAVQSTSMKSAVQSTSMKSAAQSTPTKSAAQSTPTKSAEQSTTTKSAVQSTTTKSAVQSTTTKSAVQSATMKSAVQSTPTKSAVQSTPTKSAVQSTTTKSVVTKLAVQSTTTKSAVQSIPTKSAMQSTPTKSAVQSIPTTSSSISSECSNSSQELQFKTVSPLRIVKRNTIKAPSVRTSTASEASIAVISAVRDAFVQTREEHPEDEGAAARELISRESVLTCDGVSVGPFRCDISGVPEMNESGEGYSQEMSSRSPPPPYMHWNPAFAASLNLTGVKPSGLLHPDCDVSARDSTDSSYVKGSMPLSSVDSGLDDILASFENLISSMPKFKASLAKAQDPALLVKQEKITISSTPSANVQRYVPDDPCGGGGAHWSDVLRLDNY